MWLQKDNFLSNINLRYFHVLLAWRTGPFKEERSREEMLKRPVEHEKWKISVLLCSSLRPNFEKKQDNLVTTK